MAQLHVDLAQFWKDDKLAHEDNCFSVNAPQVALGLRMSEECVLAEFGEELDNPLWMRPERKRRTLLNKRYNDKAEKIVGIRLLPEDFPPDEYEFPETKRIGEVFGGRYSLHDGSEWLDSDIKTYNQLERKLDEVDRLNLRDFILPVDWDVRCRFLYENFGIKPPPLCGVRGPITLACSLLGVENFIFLLYEEPELAERFSKTIADTIIGIAEIMEEESGATLPGFEFYDDNCCMLNIDLYESFGYPILKKVFDRFAPESHHTRFQHSDSAMEHLLPVLGKLNFTGVNFGPTVTVDKIRPHLPKARIDGCLSPRTFMKDDRAGIIADVKRDCEMAKQYGRGVNITTAGSINYGSMLEGMRTVMWAICEYGRY